MLKPDGRYCIYLRKSRADRDAELYNQSKEDVLRRHRDILFATSKNLGIHIQKIYEEVVSGDTIAARPEIQKLLREIESGIWDGVLVVEVERLARGDTKDQGIIADTFKYSDTLIITPQKIYDPNSEFDEEYFEFGLFMSRREYKTINRRLNRGRLKSAQEGKWIASEPPYGYKKVKLKGEKGYTIEFLEEEIDVARMILTWHRVGELQEDGTYKRLGTDTIALRLDSMGIKPRKSDKWSRATIRDIITNPAYAGLIRWGYKKEEKNMVNGILTTNRRRSKDYYLYDGIHSGIITKEQYYENQKILSNNNKNASVNHNNILKNPLSGIVYCAKCGKLTTRLGENSKNKYATLKCPNRYCDNVSSPIVLVEEKIILSMKHWLENYELDCNDSFETNELMLKESVICNLKKEKATLEGQLEKIYNFLEQGIYSPETFVQRNKTLTDQLQSINQNIASLQEEYEREINTQYEYEELIPKMRNIIEIYSTIEDVQIKNDLLKSVLEKVTYKKTERNTRGNAMNANFEITIFPKLPKKD